MSDITLLSISCTNVAIVDVGTKGSGFLSRMYQHATSSSDKTSADVRWVTISQSKPFAIDGRPTDFRYDQVYQSEKFYDLGKFDGIYPHLIASIRCPINMDCNIRLNVYCESVTLNAGKTVALCGCTFSRRDLLGFDDIANVTFCSKLSSEFCVGSKVYVNVIDQMSVVGANNSISPYAPVRLNDSSSAENSLYFPPNASDNEDVDASTVDDTNVTLVGKVDSKYSASRKTTSMHSNPMVSQYVYYEDDKVINSSPKVSVPIVHMNEMVFEPKRLTDIPVMLFENYSDALARSLRAWRTRRQLEVMRQGFFKSKEDANSYGWHNIRVTVVEARFDCSGFPYKNLAVQRPYDFYEPSFEDPLHDRVSEPNISNHTLIDGLQQTHQTCRKDVPAMGRSSVGIKTSGVECINTRKSGQHKRSSVFGGWGSSGLPPADVSRPSTFIGLTVHDEKQMYETVLGKTNTEYYQYNPVYGSNVLASSVRNATTKCSVDTEEKTRLTSKNASFEFKKYQVKEDVKGESLEESEVRAQLNSSLLLVHGEESTFERYIPSCENTYLVLEVNIESMKDAGLSTEFKANTPVVGVATIPLCAHMRTDMWVPFTITNPVASKSFPYMKGGHIHVELTVDSPASSSPPTPTHDKGAPSVSSEDIMKKMDAARASLECTDDNLVAGDESVKIEIEDKKISENENYSDAQETKPIMNDVPLDTVSPSYRSVKRHSEFVFDTTTKVKARAVVAPARMPYSSVYSRAYNGHAMLGPRCRSDAEYEADLPLGVEGRSLENTISDCYEWLWYCGYFGKDPLIVGEADGDAIESDVHEHVEENDEAHFTKVYRRVDVEYPIPWLDKHIADLENFMFEVLEVLQNLREIHNKANGNCFRASVLKKDWTTQPLATNCHMQMVTIRRLPSTHSGASGTVHSGLNPLASSGSDKDTSSGSIKPMISMKATTIIDSMTCGCFTAHALGHKKGGLYTHQLNLSHVLKNLTSLVDTYDSTVNVPREELLRAGYKNMERSLDSPVVMCTASQGKEATMRKKLCESAITFESLIMITAKRRILIMSQILSVAVNLMLFKLSLLEEGYVAAEVADQWLMHGFPIIFESLLSVSGQERSMLEDTIVSVDLLRLHRFRIRIAPESASNVTDSKGMKPHQRLRTIDPSTANVNIEGREITLTLPKASFEKFPVSYLEAANKDELIIYPVPVLFTQGLDIQQTYENVMGSSSSTESSVGADLPSSIELEHEVNKKAVNTLNDYCHSVKPRAEKIHSWVKSLESHVRFTGKAEKDVSLLMEIQKLCYVLGGGKVTFCKSGKDRTGMVITLEQSRILGERFECGDDLERLIRDAELMRQYGPRLQICEKNIGKPVYSINKFQTNFLPETLRPPRCTMEDINLFKSDNT
jgi:hypothetical protein